MLALALSMAALAPAPTQRVRVLRDADAVAAHVRRLVDEAAADALEARGAFALAIPGGSVLKMLPQEPSWAAQTTLVYVNHKAVPMDDSALATHAKALKGFLGTWRDVDVLLLGGSDDAAAEAERYEAAMRALPPSTLPRTAEGLPCFDMMLIGVGDDGHVGSLYPGRSEVLEEAAWVLPVEMKQPGSITLSLPVMSAAKNVVIAACGVSEKYPQGKSDGMARAIEGDETPTSFPAAALRGVAEWVIDEAAASKLSSPYLS